MREELLKGLSEEQIAKAKSCKNFEELMKLANQEGVELSEEQLNFISGGGKDYCQTTPHPTCSQCGSKDIDVDRQSTGVLFDYQFECHCRKCGHWFYIF